MTIMKVLCTIQLSFDITIFTYIIFNMHLNTARYKNSAHNIINSIPYDHINTHTLYYVGNSISKLQIQVTTYVFESTAGNCHH